MSGDGRYEFIARESKRRLWITLAVTLPTAGAAIALYHVLTSIWVMAVVFVAHLSITVGMCIWQAKTANYDALVVRWLDRKEASRG